MLGKLQQVQVHMMFWFIRTVFACNGVLDNTNQKKFFTQQGKLHEKRFRGLKSDKNKLKEATRKRQQEQTSQRKKPHEIALRFKTMQRIEYKQTPCIKHFSAHTLYRRTSANAEKLCKMRKSKRRTQSAKFANKAAFTS